VTRIRLPYVNAFRDRHGKLRHVFRRRGFKKIPLPGLPGSEEFMAAYQAALAGFEGKLEVGASRTKPGTVNAAIIGYYTSLAFRSLAPSTQRKRRLILEKFREAYGERGIATLPQGFLVKTLGKLKPFAARNLLKTLRGLLEFAVAEGFRADNPTQGLRLPKVKSRGIHTWTEEEINQFEQHFPSGTRARLALALLLGTAQRRSDVVRMGKQHIRGGMIRVRQEKTGSSLEIPIGAELARELEGVQSLTFMLTARGKAFTAGTFGDWLKASMRRGWVGTLQRTRFTQGRLQALGRGRLHGA
jgi:integrase